MADFPSNYRSMIVKSAVYPKAGALLNYDATSGAGTVDLTQHSLSLSMNPPEMQTMTYSLLEQRSPLARLVA